jgi:cation diffusion facilitator family transporter
MAEPNLRGPIALSVVAAVLTIGMKAVAYRLTDSVGLLADALESSVNLVAALTAYFSLWYAARPADPSHAYGHEKIEFFSSGLEGALVCVAGVGTAWYAAGRLFHPQPLSQLDLGAGIALVASAVNFAVARVLLHVGRTHHSIVLEADGHHLMTDVWTTVAVVTGLGLVAMTGVKELDAILALGVGLHIVVTGFRLVRRSFDGLMDHALPAAEQARLRDALQAAMPPGATFHHLRTRQAGRRRFADLHLLVDGSQTVRDAHAAAHRVEEQVGAAFPGLELTIHVEPIEEEASWEPAALARLGEPTEPPPAAGGGGDLITGMRSGGSGRVRSTFAGPVRNFSTSQISPVRSRSPESVRTPLGSHSAASTGASCLRNAATSLRAATSHKRTVRSDDADSSHRPPGLSERPRTPASWPASDAIGFPVPASQSFTFASTPR